MSTTHVIALSYAKHSLVKGSREYERIYSYAKSFASYHVIVPTLLAEGYCSVQQDGPLTLYATNSHTKVGMAFSLMLLTRQLLVKKTNNQRWVVVSQDPMVMGLIARLSTFGVTGVLHHVQVHGDIFNVRFFNQKWQRYLWTLVQTWILNHADSVRVVSQRIKNSLQVRGVAPKRIIVLPVQGNLAPFLAVGKTREYTEKERVTFLYVGRFAPEKNLSLLIRAFASVCIDMPNIRLQLLGEGSECDELFKLVNTLNISNQVAFLSWTENVSTVMAEADVYCHASWHEGYGMVLEEAMAAGLPIVTTAVGLVGERMCDGVHGMVVAPTVVAYSKALCTLAKDVTVRASYGKAGHHLVATTSLSPQIYHDALVQSFTHTG